MRDGQTNLLHAVLDFWPAGCQNALDVGCGDGQITHILSRETGVEFTGLDSSSEALKHLKVPNILAEASHIPFPDSSFDVVTTFDTLEHLDDDAEQKAHLEIFRVAKSFAIIAVPFRENLLWSTTFCHSCKTKYHINWHKRSYNLQYFLQRIPKNWQLCEGILSGERYAPTSNEEIYFQRTILDDATHWSQSMCPKCSAKGTHDALYSYHIDELPQSMKYAFAEQVYKTDLEKQYSRNHSEIILILAKNTAQYKRKPVTKAIFTKECLSKIYPNRLVDNLNLMIHCPKIPDLMKTLAYYRLRLPVYSQPTSMEIIWKNNQIPSHFEIQLQDEAGVLLHHKFDSIKPISKFHIPRKITPGTNGLVICVSAIECIDYIQCHGLEGQYLLIEPNSSDKVAYHLAAHHQWNWWIQCDKKQWVGIDQLDPFFPIFPDEGKMEMIALFRSAERYEKDIFTKHNNVQTKQALSISLRSIKKCFPKKLRGMVKKILPGKLRRAADKILNY